MDTTADVPPPCRAPRPDWVLAYGRSPDLRVSALLAFPVSAWVTSGAISVAHRSQLRGQSRNFLSKHRVPFSPDAVTRPDRKHCHLHRRGQTRQAARVPVRQVGTSQAPPVADAGHRDSVGHLPDSRFCKTRMIWPSIAAMRPRCCPAASLASRLRYARARIRGRA